MGSDRLAIKKSWNARIRFQFFSPRMPQTTCRVGNKQHTVHCRIFIFYKARLEVRCSWKQGCGVGSPIIRLQLRAIAIIRLRTDSDLQLY